MKQFFIVLQYFIERRDTIEFYRKSEIKMNIDYKKEYERMKVKNENCKSIICGIFLFNKTTIAILQRRVVIISNEVN